MANKPKLLSASDKDKLAILQNLAGSAFPVKSFIDIKITKVKSIIAPSYRFNKNITEEEMIRGALETYGVTPGS
ncbi:hypothetical protein N9T38_00570 [SAR116 cluster bacterium]|nr:hypothetical protein [SAR116 cluster bacterium]